ncbi:MAG TPA: NUDIX hydrolase [Nocardioidaceae bacterium]
MDSLVRLPPHMVEQVRGFLDGTSTPVEPRNAATIVLLREGAAAEPGALQVYLLRRHLDMAFAGGMAVFPGGGVDPRDFDHAVAWVGPPPEEWATRMGVDVPLARALVCAAVRETFEESGVLFAGPTADSIVEDTTGPDWENDRRRLEARELSFTDFLAQRGLTLRADLLRVWGAWLTPVFEPRRYMTWFFVAELPPGQETRDVSTESDDVTWMPVREAITAADREQMLVLPPQYVTFLELFDHPTPRDALAAAAGRDLQCIEPTGSVEGDQAYIALPEHLAELAAHVAGRMRP